MLCSLSTQEPNLQENSTCKTHKGMKFFSTQHFGSRVLQQYVNKKSLVFSKWMKEKCTRDHDGSFYEGGNTILTLFSSISHNPDPSPAFTNFYCRLL